MSAVRLSASASASVHAVRQQALPPYRDAELYAADASNVMLQLPQLMLSRDFR